MGIYLIILKLGLAPIALVRAPELQLGEHSSIQLMDFAWLMRVALPALASSLLGAVVADDVLTGLALHRINYDQFAAWANQVLVQLIVAQN